MSQKFSALAAVALAAYTTVAQREHDLEAARDDADHAAGDVVAALKSTPKGKAALVNESGDVDVYTLSDEAVGYKVETIAGDFDVADPTDETPGDATPTDAAGPVS